VLRLRAFEHTLKSLGRYSFRPCYSVLQDFVRLCVGAARICAVRICFIACIVVVMIPKVVASGNAEQRRTMCAAKKVYGARPVIGNA
jgi:hypothetical protein